MGALLATGLGEGGALGGGGGGTGTPTGGGGGGGGAPPFIVGGVGGGAPFVTGRGGDCGAAAMVPSFSGRGGTFILDFGGCLTGKSSYSTIFFGFLIDEGGECTFGGGEGLLHFGGRGGSGFSAS